MEASTFRMVQESPVFDEKDLATLRRASTDLGTAVTLEEKRFSVLGNAIDDAYAAYLAEFIASLEALQVGDRLPFGGGWSDKGGGHALMFVAERTSEEEYAFVVCNTGEGVNTYHPKIQKDYPKTKQRCAIRIAGIPKQAMVEEGVWFLFHKITVYKEAEHTPEMMYEVILPHLCESVPIPYSEMGPEATAKYIETLGLPKELTSMVKTNKIGFSKLLSMPIDELSWHMSIGRTSLPRWSSQDVQKWIQEVVQLPHRASAFAGIDGKQLLSILTDKKSMPGGLSDKDTKSREELHTLLSFLSKVPKGEEADPSAQARLALQILQNKDLIQTAEGEPISGAIELTGKVVGIFFSAGWCGPCKDFLPKLVALHQRLLDQGKAFQVVYLSADNSQEEFDSHFKDMPFLALPYADRETKDILDSTLGVSGIPKLFLIGEDSELISDSGIQLVQGDLEGSRFPWDRQGNLTFLRGQLTKVQEKTFHSSSLPLAVERNDAEDLNGDFETVQRSGTCFFRCVQTAFRYMLKRDGMSKAKIKHIFYLIRCSFLERVRQDLAVKALTADFQTSDRRMIEMGASQTVIAAVKELERGTLSLDGLNQTKQTVEGIADAAGAVPILDSDEDIVKGLALGEGTAVVEPYHGLDLVAVMGGSMFQVQIKSGGMPVEVASNVLNPLEALGLTVDASLRVIAVNKPANEDRRIAVGQMLAAVHGKCIKGKTLVQVNAIVKDGPFPVTILVHDDFSTEKESWTGGLTEANPPLFVDMRPGSTATTTAEAIKIVNRCRVAVDELRNKTCAHSVVLHQTAALVEQMYSSVLPLPQAAGAGVWTGRVTRDEQLQCLQDLKHTLLCYAAARLSIYASRVEDATRAITAGAILSCFDAALRLTASESSIITIYGRITLDSTPSC